MAKLEPVYVTLDDESKALIRELVAAVKALKGEPGDTSFGDGPKRLVEPGPIPWAEGDWTLPTDHHEGEETD